MAETKNPAGQGGAHAVDVVTDTREHTTTSVNNESAVLCESDGRHRSMVIRLNDRWRVIICRHGLQLILQRCESQRKGRLRWTGTRYFRTREALVGACCFVCGRCDPAGLAQLALLPEVIL